VAVIYLMRHAHSIANGAGILAGRSVGNPLSPLGKRQSRALVPLLRTENFVAIYYSPLERCLQTITPLAEAINKRPRKADDLIEMDYGSWTGQKLADLRKERLWREIQRRPSGVKFPQGESFVGAQRRIVRGLNQIDKKHGQGHVLVVTHGDVIKLAIANALGMDMDDFQRLIIDPASISVIDWRSRTVMATNRSLSKTGRRVSLSARRALGGGSNV
jgi:probable phosphomutase (TIGR03848 family)